MIANKNALIEFFLLSFSQVFVLETKGCHGKVSEQWEKKEERKKLLNY